MNYRLVFIVVVSNSGFSQMGSERSGFQVFSAVLITVGLFALAVIHIVSTPSISYSSTGIPIYASPEDVPLGCYSICPEETPTPTPTPIPPENEDQCSIYSVDVKERAHEYVVSGAGSELDCITNILESFRPYCKITANVSKTSIKKHCDDRIANYFEQTYSSGYLNEACEPVASLDDPADLCATLNIRYYLSPISLVWERDVEIDDVITINSFPLELGAPDGYYYWRASAKTPLVVYDPKHLGKITSAAQLFGSWTFGGKRSASLEKGKLESGEVVPTPWANGYEALSQLDRNHDGILKGSELGDLALWFDANQDGVSQAGEVKRLESVGVVSLFTTPDSSIKENGVIRASVGYERIEDGKTIRGESVDWYSERFTNRLDALLKLQAREVIEKKGDVRVSEKQGNTGKGKAAGPESSTGANISGAWIWKINEQDTPKNTMFPPKGILTFEDLGEEVKGHSLIEIPLKRKVGNASKFIMMHSLAGRKVLRDGRLFIRIEISSRDGSKTKSVFRVSQDGKRISGRSSVRFSDEMGQNEISLFDYSWTAERF